MKIQFIGAFFMFLFASYANAQNPFNTLPDQYFDTEIVNVLPLNDLNDYNGADADFVHSGLRDPYGHIVHFTIDGVVYDSLGVEIGELDNSATYITKGNAELLTVPKPGTCKEFYLFHSYREDPGNAQSDERPYYSFYNHENGSLNVSVLPSAHTSFDMISEDSLMSDAEWNDPEHAVRGIHFAATKERNDSTRWVFISNNFDVYRVDVTCDGLVNTGFRHRINPLSSSNTALDLGWRSELEIFERLDSTVTIAAPIMDIFQDSTGTNFSVAISIFTVDSTGAVVPNSDIVLPLEDISGGNKAFVHGLEFSPDGSKLYFTHEPNTPYPSTLSYYDFNSQTIVDLPTADYTDVENFKLSQLQIMGEQNFYYLVLASDDDLGRLQNPNSPNDSNWDPTWRSLDTYTENTALYGSLQGGKKHIVPDQIDYEDYEDIFLRSCDCCEEYAYAGDQSDTSYTAKVSDTWEYGPGLNPWDAVVGDTIYIRDTLRIEEGVSLTIQDMIFKFGKNGRVIVERGDDGPGAFLTLTDSTIFTADLRCSKRDYACAQGDSCEFKRWQGIFVEGFTNDHSQSWTSSEIHARLLVEEGSMIEFAVTGITSGNPDLSNSSGGIVRLDEAIIKDCIIGIEFRPYQRLVGSTEVFTRSFIRESSFFTTADWFGPQIPGAFVLIYTSSGLNLDANVFENQIPSMFDIDDRGIGIYAINSNILNEWTCSSAQNPCPVQDIVPSEFTNLYCGILGWGLGANIRTITDHHSLYTNNFLGVRIDGKDYPEILDGKFKVMPEVDATGIYLNGSTGYTVQNNSFETYNGLSNNRNIGIYVNESGIANNEIYRNFFTDITRGGVAVGLNADTSQFSVPGLDWLCNDFESPIHQADIYVDGWISEEQGLCNTLSSSPAGNKFSYSGSGHYDLYATSTSFIPHAPTDYNHHSAPGSFKPLTISTNIPGAVPADYALTDCGIAYDKNACPIRKSSLPEDAQGRPKDAETMYTHAIINEIASNYLDQISELEEAYEDESSEPESSLNAINYQYDSFWQDVARFFIRDTTGSITKAEMIELLQEYQPQAVERFASALCSVDEQEWVKPSNNWQFESFGELALPSVDDNGELPREIPEFFNAGFFANNGNVKALNEYYYQHNTIYAAHVIDSEIEGLEDDGKSNVGSTDIEDQRVLVQPNPFSNQVLFDISELDLGDQNARIEIYDLVGKRVYESVIPAGQNQIQMDGGNLPSGYLTFSIVVNGEIIESGKLLHLNK